MKVALYVRVSKTGEEEQNPDNQLIPLRKMAEVYNYEIFKEYIDRVTGGTSDRPRFREMMTDAFRRKFDIILVWSLDRFSREGILQTMRYIEQLKNYGVALKSLQESWLDTQKEGVADLLLAIFSWSAKEERNRIKERTQARLTEMKKDIKRKGYARTKEGKRIKTLGRPKGTKDKKPRNKRGYYLRYAKGGGGGGD